MIELKDLNIKLSDIVIYNPYRIYAKREKCLFAGRLYVSNSDNNKNDNPCFGVKWDQIL